MKRADRRLTNPVGAGSPGETDAARRLNLWQGVACGVGAAVFYTFSNTAFRQLSTQLDYVLVTSVKACLTFLFALTMLLLTRGNGRRLLPPWPAMLLLVATSVEVQLLGGVLMQRAFAIIGIALVVPIYIGAMVATAAILGRFFVGEKVSGRLVVALAVLIVSVFVLCLGGGKASEVLQSPDNLIMRSASVLDGVLSATLVGVSYGLMAVVVRYVMIRHAISQLTPVLVVSSVGATVLGTWAITRGGIAAIQSTAPQNVFWMVAGGLFNGIAFTSLAAALRRLPAVYVNAINASQAALAMLVGVVWFMEPPSASLFVGLSLMFIGFGLLARSSR